MDYQWWDLVPAVIGGIIGALAGGIPAYLLAVRASNEALRNEREERAKSDHDRIFSTFLVLSECLGDAVDNLRMIESQVSSNAVPSHQKFKTQGQIQPIANLNFIAPFRFSTRDLLIFVEGGEVKFAQELRHLGSGVID